MNNSQIIQTQKKLFEQMESNIPICVASEYESLVHFQEAYKTPVQRWYPYREGYSTELVESFINRLGINGNILDPFSGSGTTLLAARRNNLPSVGIEVNPISALVSKVENEEYTNADILDLVDFINALKSLKKSNKRIDPEYELADKMFNKDILQAMLQIKVLIESIHNDKIRKLALVSWLSSIDEVSDVKKEGNGLKYRYRKRTPKGYINIPKEEWEEEHYPGNKFDLVKKIIVNKLNICLDDIRDSFGPILFKPEIINGDCLDIDSITDKEFALTFFSPPYCNCFDYFEIHKVELWLGGFVSTRKDVKKMRETGLRSNTNALNQKKLSYCNPYLEQIVDLFDRERLWSNKIPDVVRGYFDDIHTLLKSLFSKTTPNGYVGIVIGNSAYSGVIIPSDVLVALLAQEVGFKVEQVYVARHLTTSSQQKSGLELLRKYLRESVVLLKKA